MKYYIEKIIILNLNLAFILFLNGCSSNFFSATLQTVTSFKTTPVWLHKVSFKASDNVNDSSPVTVHIVIPYTPDLYQALMQMSAHEYFAKLDQIKLDNANKIDIFEWELVRSQSLDDEPVTPTKFSGAGILVFAHYSTPGIHRSSIGEEESVLIRLNDDDFTITPLSS